MSSNSYIVGIGKFSKDINECMPYPADGYDNVIDNMLVIVEFFHCSGTDESKVLAKILGITDFWDFSQHCISENKVNLSDLLNFLQDIDNIDEYGKFKRLLNKGFIFFFVPNG